MDFFNKLKGHAQDAANIQALAGSTQLNKALRNYVREVNSVIKNKGSINNAQVRNYLSRKSGNNNKILKNRLSNGVANIVSASRVALPQAAQAAVGLAPVGPAVNAVNNATAQAQNLKFNAMLAEMEAAGSNVNKLRSIKAKINMAGFKPNNASANLKAKYNSLNARITAYQALANANTLKNNSNQQKINSVLNNLRRVQTRVPNNMRKIITNKIGNVERISLFKVPTAAPNKQANVVPTNNQSNKQARATVAAVKLWGHAGVGSRSNTANGKLNALRAAQANRSLNLSGLTRANLNAILFTPNFAPPTNNQGNNRRRHENRVRELMNRLRFQ